MDQWSGSEAVVRCCGGPGVVEFWLGGVLIWRWGWLRRTGGMAHGTSAPRWCASTRRHGWLLGFSEADHRIRRWCIRRRAGARRRLVAGGGVYALGALLHQSGAPWRGSVRAVGAMGHPDPLSARRRAGRTQLRQFADSGRHSRRYSLPPICAPPPRETGTAPAVLMRPPWWPSWRCWVGWPGWSYRPHVADRPGGSDRRFAHRGSVRLRDANAMQRFGTTRLYPDKDQLSAAWFLSGPTPVRRMGNRDVDDPSPMTTTWRRCPVSRSGAMTSTKIAYAGYCARIVLLPTDSESV